jgi:hypothetical protein
VTLETRPDGHLAGAEFKLSVQVIERQCRSVGVAFAALDQSGNQALPVFGRGLYRVLDRFISVRRKVDVA